MGLLQTAAIVSGGGQGLQRGFEQLQTGLMQRGLQAEDRAFQTEKLKQQMAHAEALQSSRQVFEVEQGAQRDKLTVALTDKKIAADAENTSQHSTTSESNTKMKIESENRTADLVHQASMDKISSDDNFHKAYVKALGMRGSGSAAAIANAEKKMDEADKVAFGGHMKAYDGYVELQKVPGITPAQFATYEANKNEEMLAALTISGHAPEKPLAKTEWKRLYGDVTAPGPQPWSPQSDVGGSGVRQSDAEPAFVPPPVSSVPAAASPQGLLNQRNPMSNLTEGKRALWTREVSIIEAELAKSPYPFTDARRKTRMQELQTLKHQLSTLPQ